MLKSISLATRRHGRAEVGSFELYLLALSWAPRFCCTNAKQCKNEAMDGVDDFSTHGLWPAYDAPAAKGSARGAGRTYPAFCPGE